MIRLSVKWKNFKTIIVHCDERLKIQTIQDQIGRKYIQHKADDQVSVSS